MSTKTNFLFVLFTSFLLSSVLLIGRATETEVDDESSFNYVEESGIGPMQWGQINRSWKACDHGNMQSPIDILSEGVQDLPNFGRLKVNYKPGLAAVSNRGHDITVKWKGDAGNINIDGTNYSLAQCHWHAPTEHTFNGTRYDMELHLIHSSSTDIAVVGIMYKYGEPDPFLAKLIPHLDSLGAEEKHVGVINPGDTNFGAENYYEYIGSLTVPPCSEGVRWLIPKEVRTVSMEQVEALRQAVHDGFKSNARPLQQQKGRRVWLYASKVTEG